ncbi:MAG: hypothetical protein R2880_19050 [Deinococcales bacterium]
MPFQAPLVQSESDHKLISKTIPDRPIKRFHGSVEIDSRRVSREVDRIAQEVLQHLNALVGSELKLSLEIQASFETGVPEQAFRIITENCQALKFQSYGFERD